MILSVAVIGFLVTSMVNFLPLFKVTFLLFTLIDLIVTLPFCTVMVQDAVAPLFMVTVITVLPVFFAVILPVFVTLATPGLEDVQDATESVSILEATLSAVVDFFFWSFALLAFNVTAGVVTVTVAVAFTVPAVAVITAGPAFYPVTMPFASTVATDGSEEVYVTVVLAVTFVSTVAVASTV